MTSMDEELYRFSEARAITHGALYDELHLAAQKLGVKAPQLFVLPSNHPNAFAAPEEGVVGLTEGMLKAFDASVHKSSPEIMAFLGHELGHLKRHPLNVEALRVSPMYALPAVTVAWCVNKLAKKEQKERGEEDTNTGLRSVANIRWNGKTVSTTASAGLGGFFAGAFASNILGREMEFMCDHAGAMVSSPEAMKRGVQIIEKLGEAEMKQFVDSKTKDELIELLLNRDTLKGLWREMTHSAHPGLEARSARLDAMAASALPKTLESSVVGRVVHQGLLEKSLPLLSKI